MILKSIFWGFLFTSLIFSVSVYAQTEQEIQSLISKYKELENAGKYQEAIPIVQQLVSFYEKSRGPDNLDAAESLNSLAGLYYRTGNYAAAEPLFKRALAIREKALGSDNPDTATSLNNLALLYSTTGNYAAAESFYKSALAIYEKVSGQDHPDTATSLNNLAGFYHKTGNSDAAEPLYKRALAIMEKTRGPDHPDTATSLNNLAVLYCQTGNYSQAELLNKRALAIREKVLGSDHPNTAISLNSLAVLYYGTGNYAAAEPLYKRALAISEKVLGPNHLDTATSLNNLAALYVAAGHYAAAEPLYIKALTIRKKNLGLDHPDTSQILNNLAALYYRTGKYVEAEPLYKKALEIIEKTFGPDNSYTASYLNNLAVLYDTIGNYAVSEPLYKRALAINEKVLGPEHPKTATSLSNIALLYQVIGNYAAAESFYKRALEITENALGPDHPDTSSSLNNLAGLYQVTGNYAAAEPLYKRALAIRKKILGQDHLDTARSLSNLAFLWLETGRMSQAFEVFEKQNSPSSMAKCFFKQGNFKQAKELFSGEYKKTAIIEMRIGLSIGLGLSCEGEKNFSEAKKWYVNAIDLIEKQRTVLTSAQREHFLEGGTQLGFKRSDAYEGMIRVLLQDNGPSAQREALRHAEMIKSRVFFEMLASRGLRTARPEDKKILQRDQDFQRRLFVLQKRMEIINKPGIKLPAGEAEEAKADLAKTQAEYEAFLKEVRLQNAEVASIICALPADPAAMQATLDDDVTVLEYYTAQDRTYAWLITNNIVRLHEIKKDGANLDSKTLQADVAGLTSGNITGKTRRPAPVITLPGDQAEAVENMQQAREAFNNKAKELYSLMVAPLEADIKTKKLVIVPHDVLHKLPFACLTDGSKALVDKYDLSVAPASSLIEFIVKKRKTDTGNFLAFANPATDKISLPFAESEVQSVENMFASKQVFSGTDATKTKLTSLSGDYDVVHFACHGEFNDMQPLQSGLLLAQDENSDGLLRIPDVFGLNLQKANLVTLSACETALTKVRGGEDWAGMSRGFIYAGTPSILATLWSVDDKSTAILMKSFYENWLKKGMTKPAALRQAQLDLKAMPEYSHPFYWAPFVMIGDWR